MLIYGKKAPPKAPKRRSRAGCIYCKEKKKKCNEMRPQCDRCAERNLACEYEPAKPRKKRRASLLLSHPGASPKFSEQWLNQYGDLSLGQACFEETWEDASVYTYATPDAVAWAGPQENDEQDVEEIIRVEPIEDLSFPGNALPSRSQYMDLATIAPCPVASPLAEFRVPAFSEFTDKSSRRSLVSYFCNHLTHLIVFKEDQGNPFRQLVLPLSHGSSPVLNAIFALSSAHLEHRGIESDEKSLGFHNSALQGLAMLIERNEKADREEVLGAIMLLVYYEVLVQQGSSNIVSGHLKGAMTIMKTWPEEEFTPAGMFLERAFRFYDVISALSWGTSPLSTIPPSLSPMTSPAEASPLEVPVLPSSFSAVDTLLGMATDLWPIIHRLSHLPEAQADLNAAINSNNTSKASVLQCELESTTYAIELALKNWSPHLPQSERFSEGDGLTDLSDGSILDDPIEGPRLRSIINNAEAYRQAALVYLYRYVKGGKRRSEKVQTHARLALNACDMVVSWEGPMSALLWPLFIGSCEAVEPEDREMARKAFDGTERRQGMTNIVKAWEVVEEVWRNDDAGEETCWREVCKKRGYNIVFG